MKKEMIINELKNIKEINKGFFDKFIEKEFMSQHRLIFFHTSHVKGKWMYYCTKCNTFHVVSENWKDGSKHRCENCNKTLEVQRYKKIDMEKTYIIKFEKNARGEMIIRYFYLIRDIRKSNYGYDTFVDLLEVGRENRKMNVSIKRNSRRNLGGYIYHNLWNEHEEWVSDRTRFCDSYPAVHIYKRNLKNVLKSTGYEYSGLKEAISKSLDPIEYLTMYDNCSQLEKLVKSNANKLLSEIRYYNKWSILSLINRVNSKQLSKIIRNDLNYNESLILSDCDVMNPDIELIRMMARVRFSGSYQKAAKKKNILKYIVNMNRKINMNKEIKPRIFYSDYRDYIEMCEKAGNELDKYPSDFWKAHDEASRSFKIYKNNLYDKEIRKRNSSKEVMKLKFKNSDLVIKPVESVDELIEESKILHHCVRKYASDVADGDTNIFFIRKIDDMEKPYCTLELQDKRVVQCRGIYNRKPDNDVISFVNEWCKNKELISCFM